MAWLMVGLYVAAIFITLPLTPLLWSVLSSYSQISFRFATSFALLLPFTGCAFFILRRSRDATRRVSTTLWRMAGLVLLATLSLLTVILLAETPAETLHLLEYGGLSYFTLRAAKPKQSVGQQTLPAASTYRLYLLCFLFVLLVGSVDEAIQFILPNRIFQAKDILLNGLCGVIGLATTTLLQPSP